MNPFKGVKDVYYLRDILINWKAMLQEDLESRSANCKLRAEGQHSMLTIIINMINSMEDKNDK